MILGIFLLIICFSSIVKCLFMIFALYSIGLFVISLLIQGSLLCIFYTSPLLVKVCCLWLIFKNSYRSQDSI